MVGRSSEVTLLLMACAVDLSAEEQAQLTAFLADTSLNWNRAYTLASRHRLTPFLYRTLRPIPSVPKAFLEALQQDCQAAAVDGLLKEQQYRQLASLLTHTGIAHMAFKGLYLARQAYPDSSLRISGDIDLLVGVDSVSQTIQLLQAHQYQLNETHALYYQAGEPRLLRDLYEVSLFKPFFTSHFDIDLHWKIVCFNKDYASFTLDYVRSKPTLTTEVQVILLISHHGVTNIWQQIYYINDLYFLLKDKAIDWTWLLPEARRYGMEKLLLVGLHWCRQVWGFPLPPTVQERVLDEKIRLLAGEYEKNWEMHTPLGGSQLVLKQLTFFRKAQHELSQLVRIYITFISSRVFRASTFKPGGRLIFIPDELGFITVFVRAARSLLKFIPAFRSLL